MITPGLVIAGTHSGCGKTTITTGLLRALSRNGTIVQPFKSGPDYIDPGFHTLASGRICRNLDTRMMDEFTVRELYLRQARHVGLCLVEGVMGLFDGSGARDERGSAAHLAKVLGLPIVLVIDCRAMARSVGAIAAGFAGFDSEVEITGFILNRVGSDRHAEILTTAVTDATGRPVVGCIRRDDSIGLPERHLGLVPAWEAPEAEEAVDAMARKMEAEADLNLLAELAACADPFPLEEPKVFPADIDLPISSVEAETAFAGTTVAVARDKAFCFYYEDNLDILRAAGATITYFSPLVDTELPEGCAAVYFGGGYPELHGPVLSGNKAMLDTLREAAASGMPMFGECGGYMYLAEAIVDREGTRHDMVGILPGIAVMGRTLAALGYCEARSTRDTVFGVAGTTFSGHVFHWSEMTGLPEGAGALFQVTTGSEDIGAGDGRLNVVGSWLHVHFASNPEAAREFLRRAAGWKERS